MPGRGGEYWGSEDAEGIAATVWSCAVTHHSPCVQARGLDSAESEPSHTPWLCAQ